MVRIAATAWAVFAASSFGDAADPRPTLSDYKASQEKDAAAKDAKAANEAKMAAVNKVTEMLESLQKKVIEEGEKEAKTYNEFACFCKDMTNEKTNAIKKGKDDKAELSAMIEKLSKEREELDDKIADLNDDISKAQKEMEKLTEESNKALSVYKVNSADLTAALHGVKEAIKVLSASKSPSLVQFQSVSKNVETALMLADALGLKSAQKAGQVFLQAAPEVEMENYKFHSSGIVDTLEGLLADFTKTKNDVDAEEVRRVQDFNMAKQKNTDYTKAKNVELDDTKARKDQVSQDIAENSQELSTVSATLLDDQQYLSELSDGCSAKAKTWDQRSKVRMAELTAITEAMEIIRDTVAVKTSSATIRFAQTGSILHTADAVANSEEAMEALEVEAEGTESSEPVGFLQKRLLSAHVKKHTTPTSGSDADLAKQMIVTLLRNQGTHLKSTLLISLAAQVSGDPFAKIKKLIQELIERLLQEAANEANQKGWCDKAFADAKQKRDMSADKVADLNAQMAKLESTISKLNEELKTLAAEIKDLTDAQIEAKKIRAEESTENKETILEAKIGLDATQKAIQILSRFYATAAKEKVDLSLSQGPFDNAPKTSFKTGEAYKGQGSDSGGVVGMMEVIASDFTRTIEETRASEQQAQKDHLKFMTESSMSLAEKKMATKQKSKYRDEAADKLDNAQGDIQAQNKILITSIKELIELQPACIDTGMSYADRVAMREQEIQSLKKALCILGAYAEYGPDGLADRC